MKTNELFLRGGNNTAAKKLTINQALEQTVYCYQRRELSMAIHFCEQALTLQANNFDANHLRGLLAYQLGDIDQAKDSLQKAVVINPKSAAALTHLGHAYKSAGDQSKAIQSYCNAIDAQNNNAEAYYSLGVIQQEQGLISDAALSYQLALKNSPNHVNAVNNLALLLQEQGEWGSALSLLDQAIEKNPNNVQLLNIKGIVKHRTGRFAEALECFDRAKEIEPNYSGTYCNSGLTQLTLGDSIAATENLQRAINIDPHNVEAKYALSTLCLLKGDLENGWAYYESRWINNKNMHLPKFNEPRWTGSESLKDKKILVISEQGLGDTLQFCRYVSLLSKLEAVVYLFVQKPLKNLLSNLDGLHQIIINGDPIPEIDYYIPLMSLPHAFHTTIENIPNKVPYIRVDYENVGAWSRKIGHKNKMKVGLVWSGGFRPDQPEVWAINERRNLPVDYLIKFKGIDAEFYSLQKGDPAESEFKEKLQAGWEGPNIINLTEQFKDFTDTAAIIENLDLVISVDTSTAHLAAALGKPVWILNRYDSCWRWLLERRDSPWYPTVTLYRQKKPGDWSDVIENVVADLNRMTQGEWHGKKC